LITAQDMAISAPAAPFGSPATARTQAPSDAAHSVVSRREAFLRNVLFVTMLLSGVAIIEPSPHDLMIVVLFVACMVAGVAIERLAVPLFFLLLIWSFGGLMSLPNVLGNTQAFIYLGTSIYLSLAAVLFATLFAQRTMGRLAVVRRAYIAAAVVCSIAGIIGYFQLVPRASDYFTLYGRATGFFKDPNVFGPFLIWPALMLIARALVERIRLAGMVLLGIILIGLLLSLSRGAWIHFAVSGATMLALLFVTARDPRFRIRLVGMSAIGAFMLVALVIAMLSIPSVRTLFFERANALNSYDVGEGGRFQLQQLALGTLLDFPFGMGPFEFARVHGLQQHNVYLQAFIVYGWLGGIAYVLMVLTTLFVGLRNALMATPWQIYAIVSLGVFVGEVGEGMVIDTDHWRHYFLAVGMIWGLAAATRHYRRIGTAHLPAVAAGP
jgi:O-antigen ligase